MRTLSMQDTTAVAGGLIGAPPVTPGNGGLLSSGSGSGASGSGSLGPVSCTVSFDALPGGATAATLTCTVGSIGGGVATNTGSFLACQVVGLGATMMALPLMGAAPFVGMAASSVCNKASGNGWLGFHFIGRP
jgi:hypothetical protein